MQQSIFPSHLHFSPELYIFKHDTSPGQLHNSIPRDQLAECLPAENTEAGTPGWFSAQGMSGLMFLKSCLNLSDEKRIERFNTDWTQLKDRIVSLAKPCVRPTIRGKENKRVAFAMKAHLLQTDGISYFDCMNFNAFNETIRLRISVLRHKSLFGACHQPGADNMYPSNANRRYLTEKQIFTCFPKKDPKTCNKQETKLNRLGLLCCDDSQGGTHRQT